MGGALGRLGEPREGDEDAQGWEGGPVRVIADRVNQRFGAHDLVLACPELEQLAQGAQVLRDGGTVASITDARARDELGGHYVWVRPDTAELAELARLGDEGLLRPEVAEVFDLADAADAHRASQSGHVTPRSASGEAAP